MNCIKKYRNVQIVSIINTLYIFISSITIDWFYSTPRVSICFVFKWILISISDISSSSSIFFSNGDSELTPSSIFSLDLLPNHIKSIH